MYFKNVIVLALLLAAGLSAGACGSSSPSAPTQLSGSTSSSISTTNGATINGDVTGAALSALSSLSDSGFATANGPGLLVTVVGTTITAQVNPNGTFVLTNVPTGDIQLHFTGPGTDALLTVTGVTGGDELRITVQVSGNTATLKDVSRRDINKVEIEGIVLSGACASFVVNGTTITTDAATEFSKGTCASVIPGAIVQVKGSTLAGGTVRATEVKFKKEDDDDGGDEEKNKIELEGLVTAGTCGLFTVRNVVVTTNATTVFKNGRCEEIAVGARVHVRATPMGATSALAMLVNIQRDADDNGKSGDKGSGGGKGKN